LTIARNANMTLVLLEVRRSNAVARRLYEGAGFSTFGVRRPITRRPKAAKMRWCSASIWSRPS